MNEVEMRILSIHPCGISRVILHAVKSYDMGLSGFNSHPRGRCTADSIALKNPSPWPGSNPQPLGPVASTLTTTPPRRSCRQYNVRENLSLVLIKHHAKKTYGRMEENLHPFFIFSSNISVE
jgi:hypothetical protein